MIKIDLFGFLVELSIVTISLNLAVFLIFTLLSGKILVKECKRHWKLLLFTLIIGAIVKLLAPVGELGGFSWEYIDNAFKILENRTLRAVPHVLGTSIIHAGTIAIFGFNYSIIEGIFVIIQVLSLALIALITFEILKNERSAMIAAAIYLFLPMNLYLSKSLLSEHYAVFFILISAYSFLIFLRVHNKSLFFLAISAFTLAAGTRVETVIFALPLLFLFFYNKAWKVFSLWEILAGLFMLAIFTFNFIGWVIFPPTFGFDEPKELKHILFSTCQLKYVPEQIGSNMWIFDPIMHPPAFVALLLSFPLFYRRNRSMFWFLALWLLTFVIFYLDYPGILFTYVPLIYVPLSMCCAVSFHELVEHSENRIGKRRAEHLISAILLLSTMPGFVGIMSGSFEAEARILHCTFSMDARNLQTLEKKCILTEPLQDVTDLGDTPKRAIRMFFKEYGIFSSVEKIKESCGKEFYYFELKRFTNKTVEERTNKEKIKEALKGPIYEGCTLNVWLVKE